MGLTTAIASVVAACAVIAPPDAQATFPGNNGKIILDAKPPDSLSRLYTINADGSDLTELTAAGPGRFASWSPDGTKIAFNRPPCDDVVTANADGTNATQLTSSSVCRPSGTLSWSPDGTEIAFTSKRDGNLEIYKMNSDGTTQTRLTNNTADDRWPSWSPDGTKIAFESGDPFSFEWDIHVMNADGTGETNVTNHPLADRWPSWTPDNKISFIRQTQTSCCDNWKFFVMNADGSGAAMFPYEGSGDVRDPAWSPDGSRIAFAIANLYLMDAEPNGDGGHNITQVATPPSAEKPDWQPIPINAYPRPKGATPFQTYLAVAYKPCTSPNEQHGSPLAVLSCTPPQQASDFLTVGTLDANGQAAKAVGSVRYDVKPGTTVNPADDADVKMAISIKDVRMKSDLSDYSGELQVSSSRRITDKDNTPAPDGTTGAATTQDTPLSITVPCASTTADDTIGSLCALSTTADAIVAGQVKEEMRSNWELGQVQVYDGGADADASTLSDNTLFMDQGVFVP
jgi:Tol biopolymer transport system component